MKTIIEKIYKLMKDIRVAEGMGELIEDWWLRKPHNVFEMVNLYMFRGSVYDDEFVLETTIGVICIPIVIPCRDCHILNIFDNPRYSKIHRVLLDEDETIEDYFYRWSIETNEVLHDVNFIDAVKWLVLWDEQGRKNCPYDLW